MAGTVTATQSGNTSGGMLLQVYVLVNAGSLGPNTLSALNVDNGSITTTVTGSMVIGALCNGNSTTSFVGEPNCTPASFVDATNTNVYGAFFTALTGTPGATTVGSTTTFAGGSGGIAACEVLASGGTLAQSSSPAVVGSGTATTLATASITPPAGSLLVAVVVTNGNATGAPTITMGTTGTIPALTWTPGPNATGLSAGFHQDIGIWTAPVPTTATGITTTGLPAIPGQTWKSQFRAPQHVPEITSPAPVPVYPPTLQAQPGLTWKTQFHLPQRPKSVPQVNPPFIAGLGGSGYNSWFQDQYGQPRLMVSEQAWLLPSNAGRWNGGLWQSDMDAYFAARSAQGYNAWYGIAWNNVHIDTTALSGGRTWDGIYPLNINGTPGAIATGSETITLNNAFWTRIDYLFGAAVKKGISCFLNISQSYDISSAGSVWQHATNTQGTAFGTALATRYPQLSYPHVFWFFGDDDDGPNDSFYQAILTGMQSAGDTRSLMSDEQFTNCNCHIEFDNKTAFGGTFGVPNSTYNWVYSYDAPYFGCEDSYAEGGSFPHIPAVYGDGVYYGDTDATHAQRAVRNFTWWALASGSRGFPCTSGPSLIGTGPTSLWQWANGSVSWLTSDPNGTFTTSTVGAIAAFFSSLPDWHKLIPDTGNVFITAGRGTRGTCDAPGGVFNLRPANTYVCGSITPAGTLAVIYCQSAFSITIDQTKLGAGYTAMWVDPLSLATQSATTGTTYNSAPLGNNSAGDPDWLLVLQGPPAGGTSTGTASAAAAGAVTTVVTQGVTAAAAGAGAVTAVATVIAAAAAAGAGAVTALATQIAPAASAGAGSVTDVVTQIASATAAGAGAVSDVVTQIAPATAAGAAAASALATQAATATAAGAATVTDVVTQVAPATSAGAGAVTDVVTQAATGTAAGAAAVTAVVTQIAPATAAGAGSVTADSAVIQAAPAPQVPPAQPGGTWRRYFLRRPVAPSAPSGPPAGTASAAGDAETAALAVQDAGQATTAAGAGTATAVATVIAAAAAAGSASALALATQQAPSAAAGAGAVADVVTEIATAAAAGAASVTAVGTSSGAATGTAAGAAAVTAVVTQIAPATAAGAGTVTDVVTQIAKATAAGAGAVNASGVIPGTASVAGAAAATATAAQAATAQAAAAGTLAALAAQRATATLTAAGSVTAAGAVQLAFTVGTLTATTQPAAALTAATAAGGTTGGTLTATDKRTGGPA